MAKFFKSIFHTAERKKAHHYDNEAEEERSETPQVGTRRQLSISRSGRMKQANKKRHSLTLELYGETIQIDNMEKPASVEYHVNRPSYTAPAAITGVEQSRKGGIKNVPDIPMGELPQSENTFEVAMEEKLRSLELDKPLEEVIDDAFKIIDKS